MLISKDLVYLELHKTGSTHVRNILSKMYTDCEIIGKHNTVRDVELNRKLLINKNLKFVGNIRNPWDWYVSLWSYGCLRRGSLYESTRGKNLNKFLQFYFSNLFYYRPKGRYIRLSPILWNKLYSDNLDFDNFNEWLKLILSDRKIHIGSNFYKENKASRHIGLLTFRYLTLYTNKKF